MVRTQIHYLQGFIHSQSYVTGDMFDMVSAQTFTTFILHCRAHSLSISQSCLAFNTCTHQYNTVPKGEISKTQTHTLCQLVNHLLLSTHQYNTVPKSELNKAQTHTLCQLVNHRLLTTHAHISTTLS